MSPSARGRAPPAVLYWFESRDELLAEALTDDEDSFTTTSPSGSPSSTIRRDQLVELIESSIGGDDWRSGSSSGPGRFTTRRRPRRGGASTSAGAA